MTDEVSPCPSCGALTTLLLMWDAALERLLEIPCLSCVTSFKEAEHYYADESRKTRSQIQPSSPEIEESQEKHP